MGQDIHSVIYVWSKIENKYVNAMETDSIDYTRYKPIFDGRNYDFFSLFGSKRSNYPELDRLKYGIPDFVSPTMRKFLEDSDWHTITWIIASDLKASLIAYKNKLKNPANFILEDEDFTSLPKDQAMKIIDSWDEETENMAKFIQETIDYVTELIEDGPSDLIIPEKTVFITFFDN